MNVRGKVTSHVMKCNLAPEEMSSTIIYTAAVRRPLALPSTGQMYGRVLCHCSVLARSTTGYYIIEYMNDNYVHVTRINTYRPGQNFYFHNYLFIHDKPVEPQFPKLPVTVKEFSESMIEFMKQKTFDTFTHNCIQARFLTMRKFGMPSDDPKMANRCIFFQGFFDYFGKSSRLKFLQAQ